MAGPSPATPAAALRLVAILDMVLGIAIALFADAVVDLGEIIPGVRFQWLVGGALVLSSVTVLAVAAHLDRKRRAGKDGAGPIVRG